MLGALRTADFIWVMMAEALRPEAELLPPPDG
jgi:hypothetical protein